ncbi:heavy metal-responsive transcriptional regulator [Pseudokineococcus basanitobsidens]|uniref:Heavy metal-responsive transcriptional regulator n=1 Tax=Pseudokineococcus basanitobsidens TaxID=1926649 RepID=A0ABU8RPC2_9ACTN
MRIGEAAAAAGVSTQTIRFYERRGLLPQPQRGVNGYREYDASVLARLAFIRSGQAAGLTLVELSNILELRRDGTVPCAHVDSLLRSKLDGIRARRRELAVLEAELEGLISRSDGLDPADCTETDICHVIVPGGGTRARAGGTCPRRVR